MTKRIVMGYWDCESCNTKKIQGTAKNCPYCGAPKGNAKYYLDMNKKDYLNEETAKKYGNGANWLCPYCLNQNRYYSMNCESCGASKMNFTTDYFGNNPNEVRAYKETSKDYSLEEKQHNSIQDLLPEQIQDIEEQDTTNKGLISIVTSLFMSYRKQIFIGMAIVATILLLIVALVPNTYNAIVTSNSWERTIEIEQYRTVKENDWFVPSGGRVYNTIEEIHHYDSVLDHYDTVTVEKSREVLDHYDYHIEYSYSDNGDGTFTEYSYEVSTPVYRTEYYTETEQRPVYIDVPRYATKFYYEIERLVYHRTEKTNGSNDEKPYWPEYQLAENERISDKTEEYSVIFTTEKKISKQK